MLLTLTLIMMEHAGNASSQTVEQEGLPCSAPPKVRLRCGWGLALTVHLEHPPLSSRVHPVLRHSFYLQVFPGKRTHSAPSCPAPVPPPRGSPLLRLEPDSMFSHEDQSWACSLHCPSQSPGSQQPSRQQLHHVWPLPGFLFIFYYIIFCSFLL